MQEVKSICTMREIMLALHSLEGQLIEEFGLDLKEAMLVCTLSEKRLSTSEIASALELRMSHTSKIIASLEKKDLLIRHLGTEDKRRMFFELNSKGGELLRALKVFSFEIPSILEKLF